MQSNFKTQQNTAGQGAQQALTDQELAFDLLYQEKALMANISSEVVEGSQPGLRNVMNDMFMQMGQDQLQIFQIMNNQGWYQLKPAPAQDIQTAKQKYEQMRTTL
ncbi:MAG: spore coat protein [Clostridia bacterium]|nr:spore coat protein [Clostridia bacterium]